MKLSLLSHAARLLLFPCGLLNLCSLPARAQATETAPPEAAAPSLTLDQAIARALETHPSLSRIQEQAETTRTRIGQARSGQQPTVAVQGMASNGPLGAPTFGPLNNPALNGVPPIGPTGLTGDPVKKQFGASLNVQGTLIDFGRTRNLVGARENQFAAAETDIDAQRALVVLSVQEAYYTALRQQQMLIVQQENVRQRETTFRQAKLFVEGDLKAGVDLQTAKANVAEAQVGLLAAENDFRIAMATLNYALGSAEQPEYRLVAPPGLDAPDMRVTATPEAPASPPAPVPASLEDALTTALKQRPELQSLDLQIAAAEQATHSVESEKKPRLDAIGSIGAINPSHVITTNQNYGVAAILTIPVYSAGMVEGRIAEERKKRDALLAQRKELTELVKLQVKRAWLNRQTRQAQIAVAREQVEAARNSARLAGERYRLQLTAVVELTDAEATRARAEAQWVNSTYDAAIAQAELDWATGETHRRYTAKKPEGTKTP